MYTLYILFDAFTFALTRKIKLKMSQVIKYVGKKSKHTGKTLWELLGNLENFGVGRIVVRNEQLKAYAKPSEPCYMKILEVKTDSANYPEPYPRFRPPNDHRDKDVSGNSYEMNHFQY